MSIITNKPQTTRHRIIGLVSGEDYQVVFSDTPGVIEDPAYRMQESMNHFAFSTFEDADIMMFVTEPGEDYADDDPIIQRLQNVKVPLFLVLNKIDTVDNGRILELIKLWNDRISFTETIPISALQKVNTERLMEVVMKYLPEG